MASSSVPILSLAILGVLLLCSSSAAHLTTDYYCESCPNILDTIKNQVKLAVARDRRTGAQILRLFFHDCFVQGCDASLLLDDTPTLIGEKRAAPNFNSARGFEVIDTIKAAVEKVCPEVVSCADILAIAARDFVVELGGPYWDVKTGRRDSLTANQGLANISIPRPTNNLNMLISSFQAQGLSTQDMVALSGAHTIGVARCTSFRNRIYNEANIDKFFASTRQANCPRPSGSGDNNLAPLDLQTPLHFDNNYYKNLVGKKGLLHSDQQLYNGGSTDYLVSRYSQDTKTFNKHFVEAMIKMGDIKPLTGSKGQVRKNCRRAN